MFRKNLRLLRQTSNLTQAQLATTLNVSRTTISHWELGESEPSIDELIKLADIFSVSTDMLLGRTNDFKKYENKDELSLYIEDCIRLYFKHIKK